MIVQHIQLFKSLNSHGVEYLLIGGTLAIAYGVPRVTKDPGDLEDIKILQLARQQLTQGPR
ncbi:MAG: hypothetical protein HY696_11080 [Deltaproteobacteria bacterium]|nr:hypothetical protein [Deltaproteobacteria bacterium]